MSAQRAPTRETPAAITPTVAPQSSASGGPSPNGGLACASRMIPRSRAPAESATPAANHITRFEAGSSVRRRTTTQWSEARTSVQDERASIRYPKACEPGDRDDPFRYGDVALKPGDESGQGPSVASRDPYQGSIVLMATPADPRMHTTRANRGEKRRAREGLVSHGGSEKRSIGSGRPNAMVRLLRGSQTAKRDSSQRPGGLQRRRDEPEQSHRWTASALDPARRTHQCGGPMPRAAR